MNHLIKCKGNTCFTKITIIITNHHYQIHQSLSPWPASTHSKLPLHWALHLIVVLSFQVNFDGEDSDNDEDDDGSDDKGDDGDVEEDSKLPLH